MRNQTIIASFEDMEARKESCLSNDDIYKKAVAKVEDLLEELEKELPEDKKNLIEQLKRVLKVEADERDILIYSLGLIQGIEMRDKNIKAKGQGVKLSVDLTL